MDSTRVLIADDHKLYTEALTSLLESQSSTKIKVKAVVHNGKDVLESISRNYVDIVLLDLNMPGEDGLELIPKIKRNFRDLRIIVVTMYDQSKFIQESLKAGADAYVLKSSGIKQLMTAIAEVKSGNTYISDGLMIFPKEMAVNGKSGGRFEEDSFTIKSKLTKRELEILKLISDAKSNKDIAEELFISDQTVSVHRKNIMRKLNVSNTASLIKFAMDHHLI